ncbi:glycosyltransferase [Cytobacillus sp. BC1816]|uniref:glycosyltransferase n=1 Tax=Cytobacillus sp. BC1816 TaxID=3440154 RepID=UPI003F518E75
MNKELPLVSVLIPFYNCRYVDQAIKSVFCQTYKNIEVILINDGSSKYNDLITPFLSNIIYLEQKNSGVAAALNRGLKKAKGEYLVWLSSDDLFGINKIQFQLEFMKVKNSLFSFTNFNIIDKNNTITKHNVGMNFKNDLEIIQTFLDSNPINGCTVMMSKEVIETIGFFNEDLKYAQDYDFWIRAALNFPLNYYHCALTNYRVHESMGSVRHNREQMQEFYKVREIYKDKINKILSEKKGEDYA